MPHNWLVAVPLFGRNLTFLPVEYISLYIHTFLKQNFHKHYMLVECYEYKRWKWDKIIPNFWRKLTFYWLIRHFLMYPICWFLVQQLLKTLPKTIFGCNVNKKKNCIELRKKVCFCSHPKFVFSVPYQLRTVEHGSLFHRTTFPICTHYKWLSSLKCV